jgi:hypothetical protein
MLVVIKNAIMLLPPRRMEPGLTSARWSLSGVATPYPKSTADCLNEHLQLTVTEQETLHICDGS